METHIMLVINSSPVLHVLFICTSTLEQQKKHSLILGKACFSTINHQIHPQYSQHRVCIPCSTISNHLFLRFRKIEKICSGLFRDIVSRSLKHSCTRKVHRTYNHKLPYLKFFHRLFWLNHVTVNDFKQNVLSSWPLAVGKLLGNGGSILHPPLQFHTAFALARLGNRNFLELEQCSRETTF